MTVNVKKLTVRIKPELDAELSAIAKDREVSKTHIIREAIKRILKKERRNERITNF